MSAAPERILLIRFKSIGDVLLLLPAVSALRKNFPSARITFLTSAENALFLGGFRDVDEVLLINRKTLRSGNPFKVLPEFFGLLRKLRGGKFDLVVDFQGYGETAWLSRLTGAAERWGVVYSTGRQWAYTRDVPRREDIHPATGHLEMLRQCGLKIDDFKNEFVPPPAALAGADAFLAEQKIDPACSILYVQPLTSSPHKNWPLENYLAVAQHFRAQGVQVIFSGGPADLARMEPVRQQGFVLAAGLPRLTDMGLLQRSTLVLGGDTGFIHLAVAMGRRVVMLMPAVHPGSAVPFHHPDWAIAAPAGTDISKITVPTVLTACTPAVVVN
jgi:ADP-heptose:LPS heptosyltransferase